MTPLSKFAMKNKFDSCTFRIKIELMHTEIPIIPSPFKSLSPLEDFTKSSSSISAVSKWINKLANNIIKSKKQAIVIHGEGLKSPCWGSPVSKTNLKKNFFRSLRHFTVRWDFSLKNMPLPHYFNVKQMTTIIKWAWKNRWFN